MEKLVVGELQANCYLLADRESKEAIVIDPGGEAEKILKAIGKNSLKIVQIVDTHAHLDHIGANDIIRERTGASLLIHSADIPLLKSPEANLSLASGIREIFLPPTGKLKDGDEIKVGRLKVKVLHTPGHTPGSICLQVEDKLFTGDTLFAGSVGRTDLPGGDFQKLLGSIRKKLLSLPDRTVIYPGHGPNTTMGEERRNNPFVEEIS